VSRVTRGPVARTTQTDELARNGRYPSGPIVPAVSRAFAALERGNLSAAIDAVEPIANELERIGGSHAQLDLVEFTLLRAYLSLDHLDDARRMMARGVEVPRAFRFPGWQLCTDRRNDDDLDRSGDTRSAFPELLGARANGKVAPDSSRSVDVD
jgi:hypothetical protein